MSHEQTKAPRLPVPPPQARGPRPSGLMLYGFGLLLDVLAFAAALMQRLHAGTAVVIIFMHIAACAITATALHGMMPRSQQIGRRAGLLFLFSLNFFMPLFGALGMFGGLLAEHYYPSRPPPPSPWLTVDLPEVNKESLAIALLGTTAAVSQASGTITDEAVTITAKDTWYALSKAWFTTITAKDAADTALVEGVDFIVDKDLGWIKVLTGSALVTNGEVIKVSGTYKSATGSEIKAMTDAQLRARFKLVGKNFADNLPYIVTVHEAVIAADSAFDFLQDDFASISLPGRMKTPTGFTEPATVVQMTSVS